MSVLPSPQAEASPQAGAKPALRGTVLFVHGLWMSGIESFLLRRYLATHGWALRVFPYSSLGESMERVARRCARRAMTLARTTERPVHLMGHSLGGIVIYRMFETGLLAPDRFSGDFCRVVFMGTPVRGSQSARALAAYGPARRLLGLAGAQDLVKGLPDQWTFPAQLGIVAGNDSRGIGRFLTRLEGDNDGTVSVEETRLAGATDFCVLPVTHSSMWLSAEVAARAVQFYETGRFAAPADAGPRATAASR